MQNVEEGRIRKDERTSTSACRRCYTQCITGRYKFVASIFALMLLAVVLSHARDYFIRQHGTSVRVYVQQGIHEEPQIKNLNIGQDNQDNFVSKDDADKELSRVEMFNGVVGAQSKQDNHISKDTDLDNRELLLGSKHANEYNKRQKDKDLGYTEPKIGMISGEIINRDNNIPNDKDFKYKEPHIGVLNIEHVKEESPTLADQDLGDKESRTTRADNTAETTQVTTSASDSETSRKDNSVELPQNTEQHLQVHT